MIHIRYFASLRDQMGRAEESLETTASTPKALIAELQARDRQAELLGEPFVRIIINDEIAELESPLSPGDTVAFCPPFSGG